MVKLNSSFPTHGRTDGSKNPKKHRWPCLSFSTTDGVFQYIDPDNLNKRCMDDKSPEEMADANQFLCEKFSVDNYTGILLYYESDNDTPAQKKK